jgi:hypothetical protein
MNLEVFNGLDFQVHHEEALLMKEVKEALFQREMNRNK